MDLNTGSGSGGDAAGDTLNGIEDIVGSAHNDSLKAGAGANSLSGGDGNDWLTGGAGPDDLDGGDGIDWVSYSGSGAGVTVNLATGTGQGGDAEGDTLTNIENIWGSSHDDTLTGDDGDNWFYGGAGMMPSTAAPALPTRSATRTPSPALRSIWGRASVRAATPRATPTPASNMSGRATDDHLIGNDAGNWLFGAEGDDLLEGGAGGDSLDGGEGIDAVTYSMSDAWVGVDLANGTGWNGHARYDTYTDVENAFGSDHNDDLRGNDGDNFLAGKYGNDWFQGRGGADGLHGGGGSDWASYEDSAAGVTVNLASQVGFGRRCGGRHSLRHREPLGLGPRRQPHR